MFEPEYLNLTCPRCESRGLYVDGEIGFYCMFCGRRFTAEEVGLLIDTEILRAPRHAIGPDRLGRVP